MEEKRLSRRKQSTQLKHYSLRGSDRNDSVYSHILTAGFYFGIVQDDSLSGGKLQFPLPFIQGYRDHVGLLGN